MDVVRTPLLIAAALLTALPALEARAQSAAPDRAVLAGPNAEPAKTKPAPTKRQVRTPAPQRTTGAPAPNDGPSARNRDVPRIQQQKIGRVPFETGTLGFTTSRQYSNSTFADGRVTPGFENVQTREPSYFGFSLSVPTDKQRLIPLPGFSRQD